MSTIVAMLFAVPVAIAGYHATHGIAALTMPSTCWQEAFAILSAAIVGATALARIGQPIVRPA